MTATEYPIRLKMPTEKAVPVKLDCVALEDRTILIIRGENGLYIELVGLSRIIYPLLLNFVRVANPDSSYGQKVRELTPEMVVSYFEASPVLSYMADDVRGALLPAGADKVNQVELDLAKVAHLKEPSLADISEVLTGRRYYRGSTYARVKAVQNVLISSSSPDQGDQGQLKRAA